MMQTNDFDEYLDDLGEEQLAINVGMANRWWKERPDDNINYRGRDMETKVEIYFHYLKRTPIMSFSLAQAWWRLLEDRNKVRVYFGEELEDG